MGKIKEIIEKLKKSNVENTPEFKTAEKSIEITKDLENDIIQSILIFLKNHEDRNEDINEDINLSYVVLLALALATSDIIKTFHNTGFVKDGYNCQDVLEHYKTDILDNIFDMDEEDCPKS